MAVMAPMIVAAIGILLSIAGMFMVRCKEGATQKELLKALLVGTLGSSVLILIVLAVMAQFGHDYLGHLRFGCFRLGRRCGHWSDHRVLYL